MNISGCLKDGEGIYSKELAQPFIEKVGSLKNRLVYFPINTQDKKYVEDVLDLAKKHFKRTSNINEKELLEFQGLVNRLEEDLENQRNISNILLQILDRIKLNLSIVLDPLFDPILDGIEVIENTEDSEDYSFKNNYTFFPSAATDPNIFFYQLKKFNGRIQVLPKSFVQGLIDDPGLNKPSTFPVVLDDKERLIPLQVHVDLKRVEEIVINETLLYRNIDEANGDLEGYQINETAENLYLQFLKLLNIDIDQGINISRLITQASMAHPCEMIYLGFVNLNLGVWATPGLKFKINISTSSKGEKSGPIRVALSIIFGIKISHTKNFNDEGSITQKYISVLREIYCDREFLENSVEKKNVRGGNACVRDLYSPIYDCFDDASNCKFSRLQNKIKVYLKGSSLKEFSWLEKFSTHQAFGCLLS